MHNLLLLAALEALSLTTTVSANKVMPMRFHRNTKRVDLPRKLKRNTISEPLGNAQSLYYANVTVGTPGQMISLQLDTGSSDVWVTAAGDSFCNQNQYNCPGGVFDPTQSSTYTEVQQGGFNISYVDGTGSTGDYFSDVFSLANTNVQNLTMGLATQTSIGTGIIGVSFAADESICEQQSGPCQTYPTLLKSLVSQKAINSQAYSLWLDDLSAQSGTILFGGVDSSQWTGDLITIPIEPDAQSDSFTSFTVAWTSFSIGTPKGEETQFVPSNFLQPAVLDSGTTTLVVQDPLFQQLAQQFGAVNSQEFGTYVAPCYLETADATFDFTFGGSGGPVIKVPVSEFLLDLGTDQNGNPITFANGDQACQFGIESNGAQNGVDSPIIFGDTFLRSAYVVYDLDNKQISIAQSNFNPGSPDVKEISSQSSSNVPGVASTVSGSSITAAATGPSGQKHTQAVTSGASGSIAASGGAPPLAQFTTASYTGGAVTTGSGGSGKGAAPVAAPMPEVWAIGALVGVLSLVGTGLVFF